MNLFEKQSQSQILAVVAPQDSVAAAAEMMSDRSVGSVLVLRDGTLEGIFTERDLLNRVVAKDRDPKATPVSEVMSRNVVTVDLHETVEACFAKMQSTKSRHVPVVDGGRVVGMVTMRNILEWLWKEIEEENAHLKNYIRQS